MGQDLPSLRSERVTEVTAPQAALARQLRDMMASLEVSLADRLDLIGLRLSNLESGLLGEEFSNALRSEPSQIDRRTRTVSSQRRVSIKSPDPQSEETWRPEQMTDSVEMDSETSDQMVVSLPPELNSPSKGISSTSSAKAVRTTLRHESDTFGVYSVWDENRPIITTPRMESHRSRVGDDPDRSATAALPKPASVQRLFWDFAGVLLIAYDGVSIPIALCFDPLADWLMGPVFWFSVLYWTMDIVVSCFSRYSGYGVDRAAKRTLRQTVYAYLSSWLLFDLVMVTVDWAMIFIEPQWSLFRVVRMGKVARIARMIRAARLLRLMRMRSISNSIHDRFATENVYIWISIVQHALFILAMNHFIACLWYGLGVSGLAENSWTDRGVFDVDNTLPYRYFTCLHWSLTQFTPASMEVIPVNVYERAFSVTVIMLALIVFSSFVGGITTLMTRLRDMSTHLDRSVWLLRRYLRTRSISAALSVRIIHFVEFQLSVQRQHIRESRVLLLKLLSKPLQMELARETYEPTLVRHPLFRLYTQVSEDAIQHVCSAALVSLAVSKGDTVFVDGASDDRMIIVYQGTLRYREHQDHSQDQGPEGTRSMTPVFRDQMLEAGEWCSEASLWTTWTHVGTLQAPRVAEVLAVVAGKFADVTLRNRWVSQPCCRYANDFVEHLNKLAAEDQLSDIIDLPGSGRSIECRDRAVRAFASFAEAERFSFSSAMGKTGSIRTLCKLVHGKMLALPGRWAS